MKLIWTELALEKLEEFADYIALDKPMAALEWTELMQDSVKKIVRHSSKITFHFSLNSLYG